MMSVIDYLSKRAIPWEEAAVIASLEPSLLAKTDDRVLKFLVASIGEILADQSLVGDIHRRIKTGAGVGSSLDHLITEAMGPESLEKICISVFNKASRTFENVVERGRSGGDPPMDSSTASYIRRQVLTESIVREIVISVKNRVGEMHAKNAKDGFLFAFAPTASGPDIVSPADMGHLMTHGYCVIKYDLDVTKIVTELIRLEALMMFDTPSGRDDAVLWIDSANPGPEKDRMKALLTLCERLQQIPFELNRLKKDLMLQVIQHFQVSCLDKGQRIPMRSDGRKLTAIVPLATMSSASIEVVRLSSGQSIFPSSKGQLILIDSSKVQYECPTDAQLNRRFYVFSYLTGPP